MMTRRPGKQDLNYNEDTTMGEVNNESVNFNIAMNQMNDWLDVYTIGNKQAKKDEDEPER
jgi:hypothetical protein